MPATQIKQITISNDEPTVRFSTAIRDGEYRDSVFPGKGSEPVFPAYSFKSILDEFSILVESTYSLSTNYEWRLVAVIFLWDKENDEYGVKVKMVSGLGPESDTQKVEIEQSSPDHVPTQIAAALEKLMDECILFVGGKSAQGNLLEMGADAA